MKKLKNKFILLVIGIMVIIVGSQSYIAYSNSQRDTNSYLTLIQGAVFLNATFLEKEKKYILVPGDKISVDQESLALIEWGDGSLTRLGENTKISIEENQVSRDYTKIQISFELIAGKTWSNVISFLGEDSSFTQTFQGMEAGVRGTVFDVDLEQDFINVTDHQVILTDTTGQTLLLEEGKPVKISNLTLIEIQEFLSQLQDSSWTKLNESYDAVYFETLKQQLQTSLVQKTPLLFLLDWISPKYRILYELDTATEYQSIEILLQNIPEKKTKEVYDAVFSRYQDFNFVGANEYEFYKRKVFYKKALLILSPSESEKQQLVRLTAYDLENILQSETQLGVTETLEILLEHKDILQNIDTSFLEKSFNLLPEEMLEKFQGSFDDIQKLFHTNFDMTNFQNLGIGNIKEKAEEKIQDFLDDTAGSVLEKFSK